MHGEFSRLTFDPRKHFSGVYQQQGRVGLDSDWNEWVELTLRRLAIETTDVIGSCGRPKHAAGFGIRVVPGATPHVLFSPGRLYTGGMLAELEQETDFLKQYDWPIPAQSTWTTLFSSLPWPGLDFTNLTGGASRRDLFYVEVWQRHVTALNDEAERAQYLATPFPFGPVDWNARPEVGDLIRERALGGPDTCTRSQIVAQVKSLTITDSSFDCEGACARLAIDRPKASTGTMQVLVQPTPPITNPCEGPQTGGYGGAENRTYRVEIHDPGPQSTATFKWSTENGAFMVRVEEPALTRINAGSNITLQSIGNDQTTQLKAGDWVEMCGEETELGMFRNPLAQVAADPTPLADGRWRIRLLLQSVVVPRAPFLRRWSGPVRPIVLGTSFPLDTGSGLSVRFTDSIGGGNPTFFHDLDYWIWAARTSTRDVEPATLANTYQRARGPERSYCCLALVTWNRIPGTTNIGASAIAECDNKFPPLTEIEDCCCCTITVGDGVTTYGQVNDLARAFARLPAEGGVICILPGTYILSSPISIPQNNVVVHGCGRQTVILAPSGAFIVFRREQIVITGLTIDTLTAPAIVSADARRLKILDNDLSVAVRQIAPIGTPIPTVAIDLQGSEIEVSRNEVLGSSWGGGIQVRAGSGEVFIRNNKIDGGATRGIAIGPIEIGADENVVVVDSLEIANNRIGNMDREGIGPALAEVISFAQVVFVRGLRIIGNTILNCAKHIGTIPGFMGAVTLLDVEHGEIYDNRIEDNGSAEHDLCGIFIASGSGVRINDNRILRNGRSNGTGEQQAGIWVRNCYPPADPMNPTPNGDGWPALAVCRNVVACNQGPALQVTGIGRMMFVDNQLTSHGIRPTSGIIHSLHGVTVSILNLGFGEAPFVFGGFANLGRTNPYTTFAVSPPPPSIVPEIGGEILFAQNQILLEAADNSAYSSLQIVTGDDLRFSANQCRYLTKQFASYPVINTDVFAASLSVEGSRFRESPVPFSFNSLNPDAEIIVSDGIDSGRTTGPSVATVRSAPSTASKRVASKRTASKRKGRAKKAAAAEIVDRDVIIVPPPGPPISCMGAATSMLTALGNQSTHCVVFAALLKAEAFNLVYDSTGCRIIYKALVELNPLFVEV